MTAALPAEPETASAYLADTISIALAGCKPEDVDTAKAFEVPREAYLAALRFFVTHSDAYEDLRVDDANKSN